VSDKTVLGTDAPGNVMQDLREQPDDTIALIIAVAVVEFLEVVEVRVTDREQQPRFEPPRDLVLDGDRAGQSGRRMDVDVPIRPARRRAQAGEHLLLAHP
jgi:hypothetical protein